MNDTWLAHHGILGQKWGIRRFQNKDGSYTAAGKKRYKPEGTITDGYQEHKIPKGAMVDGYEEHSKPIGTMSDGYKDRNKDWNKNRHDMSDKDLDDAINRLKKEKQLDELTAPGKVFAKTVLTDAGKRVLTTVAVGGALYAGKVFAGKILKNSELGNAIFNGGPKKK